MEILSLTGQDEAARGWTPAWVVRLLTRSLDLDVKDSGRAVSARRYSIFFRNSVLRQDNG